MSGGAIARKARVMVIGAGVSGCACAATLAQAGARVMLLNPALDRVGEPSFGPLVARGAKEVSRARKVMKALPDQLAAAWRDALLVGDGEALWVCDRRLVSIGMKKALEGTDGLELRQGLAVGLEAGTEIESRPSEERAVGPEGLPPIAMRVETAFGEQLWSDAVVVAVGLSLGGSVLSGDTVVGAGRYGQSASDGLDSALRRLGADMSQVKVAVEPRAAGSDWGTTEAEPRHEGQGAGAGERCNAGALVRLRLHRMAGDATPDAGREGPPSPYGETALSGQFGLGVRRGEEAVVALAWPDGLATGEMVVMHAPSVEHEGCAHQRGGVMVAMPETRPGYTVRGGVVRNLRRGGLLGGLSSVAARDGAAANDDAAANDHAAANDNDVAGCGGVPVWVTGRASGAGDYVASLEAGVVTARSVAEALTHGYGCA